MNTHTCKLCEKPANDHLCKSCKTEITRPRCVINFSKEERGKLFIALFCMICLIVFTLITGAMGRIDDQQLGHTLNLSLANSKVERVGNTVVMKIECQDVEDANFVYQELLSRKWNR